MKRIFTYIFLSLFFTLPVSAEIEFFLNSQWEEYSPSEWTSQNFPDPNSNTISLVFHPELPPLPAQYIVAETELKEIIQTVFTQIEQETVSQKEIPQYATELYEVLLSQEVPQFTQYISSAISEELEKKIEEKISENIVLSPYEEKIYSCNIPLSKRQEIVIDVLQRLQSGEIEDIENITYSDPSFGDCVVPFPDIRHRNKVIAHSFQSNQEIAKSILGTQKEWKVHESITQLAWQKSNYQEYVLENSKFIHDISSKWSITSQQKKLLDDNQKDILEVLEVDALSNIVHTSLSEKSKGLQELQKYFTQEYLEGRISEDHFMLLLWQIQKNISLQKSLLALLKDDKISQEDFLLYIDDLGKKLQDLQTLYQNKKSNSLWEEDFAAELNANIAWQNDLYQRFEIIFSKKWHNSIQHIVSQKYMLWFALCISVLISMLFVNKNRKKKWESL